MKNRIKNIVKQVFLTEDENKRLLALMANEKESNFSAFARKKLFNQEIESWTINFPEYEQLTERFIQIGRSINRIAKLSTQVGNISQQNFIELGQLITLLIGIAKKIVILSVQLWLRFLTLGATLSLVRLLPLTLEKHHPGTNRLIGAMISHGYLFRICRAVVILLKQRSVYLI